MQTSRQAVYAELICGGCVQKQPFLEKQPFRPAPPSPKQHWGLSPFPAPSAGQEPRLPASTEQSIVLPPCSVETGPVTDTLRTWA